MNAEQFLKVTGRVPVNDDLARANCSEAGKVGHWGCGVCARHGMPVFACIICFAEGARAERIPQMEKTRHSD